MRSLWLVALAGCSFHSGLASSGAGDAGGGDGDAMISDAMFDDAVTGDAIMADAPTPTTPITFVQVAETYNVTSTDAVSVAAPNEAAGNCNVVMVVWIVGGGGAPTVSVTDSHGISYAAATTPLGIGSGHTVQLFYAPNLPGGTTTVTAAFSVTVAQNRIRVLEYAGIAASQPLDGAAVATGTGTTGDSGALTTTNAHDLLVGAMVADRMPSGAGTGYTQQAVSNNSIIEDQIVTAAGSYHATATIGSSASWAMQLAAFKGAN